MNPELKLVMFEEKKALQDLLHLLDKQHEVLIAKDLIALEKLTEKIEAAGKGIAAVEIKRRSLIKEETFSSIIENSEDIHLEELYKEIKAILNGLEIQKSTNDILIKQNLFFTNKMIQVIKPSKSAGTYNSYGKVGR